MFYLILLLTIFISSCSYHYNNKNLKEIFKGNVEDDTFIFENDDIETEEKKNERF